MKRIGYIYEKIYDKNNIIHAMFKASLGKRKQNRVKKILDNADYYASKIQEMLVNKTFVPSNPDIKVIQDGANKKERTIYKPKFYPDQIVHWSLMLQLEPIMMRGMYAYSCGSVPKRGTSLGQKMVRQWLDKDKRNTKYCLKMDIKKFYPSINNEILKKSFKRKIKDKDCQWLINTIIDAEDGLPIGYYTSQWFANFVLEPLDHFIKEKLRVKYYVRYVDDLVLFGPNKKKLHKVRVELENFLNKMKLTLKGNWQVFRIDKRDIDFLGFRFFRNKTILRKSNALRIRRRVKKIAKKPYMSESDASAVISYWGWIKRSDSYSFYHKHVKPYVTIDKARKVVSYYAKVRNHPEWGIGIK
ncbi:RNA-directed DNA polymerase [Bacillus benzoevorans]|uniref:Reverse transcriptase domain-containing protein n=1 Tax=Bacillus benzoevorans TaxID=1456 RepID=A0A7X0LXI1_9BACI|nr:RNA-directed DNA polymerase [Bacillus benzoevorans]MBB6446444.1 hypothetical protein [Bacillus benzoevorans]